jgi:UDP-3-O-[3-hydroxymyristoyl] glucosamine N-acyltransferase
MAISMTLGELAVRFGLVLRGDPDARVSHVGTLEGADASSVTFLANPRYKRFLRTTRAGAVVLDPRLADECPVPALLAKNPYAAYARIAAALHPPRHVDPGIHPSAAIDPQATIDATAHIGAQCVIAAGARIGPRAVIGPGSVVLEGAVIGADTRLVARVTVCEGVTLGERCLIHPGVVIGADGFGLAPDRGEWVKVPQVGGVRIGDDVEVGANTTIDRGAIEDTVIEDGVKLDNQIQIAHNVRVGAHTVMAGMSGISGSTTVGKRCMIGGQVGIAGHLTICDDVVLTGRSFVSSSIKQPGTYSSGLPVEEASRFRKNAARFYQLDEFMREMRKSARSPGGSETTDEGGEPSNE